MSYLNYVDESVARVWCIIPPRHDGEPRLIDSERLGIIAPRWESTPHEAQWLLEEISHMGLDELLVMHDGLAHRWDYSGWMKDTHDWMMKRGIAPGQRFFASIPSPTYTCDYFGEHDVFYNDVEIVHVEPWDVRRVLKAWDYELDDGPRGPVLIP